MVRKEGQLVCQYTVGYEDIPNKKPVTLDTMFRLASMSKPVTAIAVMQLVEQGKIGLYDPISRYIPEFSGQKVCEKNLLPMTYAPDANSPTGQKAMKEEIEHMTYIPAQRDITVFDLLTHSSGLAMGPVGNTLSEAYLGQPDTLLSRAKKYATLPLDFQPGTFSGYSAMAAFEVLGCLVEMISGLAFEEYLKKNLFLPLGATDLAFTLTSDQLARVPRLYEYTEQGTLMDVTDDSHGWDGMDPTKYGYHSGAGGLFGTVRSYERIAHMLLNKGQLDGVRVLKEETVEEMAGKGISHDLEPFAGCFWGLGMMVFGEKKKTGRSLSRGTFGWSGAFGTHFYMDPDNQLEMVLGINRSNIGGAGSYVSFAVEEAIYQTYLEKE